MSKPKWDLTSLRSLESAAEWIWTGSGALLVLVVRLEDIAFAVDPQIKPKDATEMVRFVLDDVQQQLETARQARREADAAKAAKTAAKTAGKKGWTV